MSARPRIPNVVICGGGVAAVEALLALRAHRKVGVELHLVAPNRELVYQPLAVAAPFGLAETHVMGLVEFASEQGAKLHVDSLAQVYPQERRVRLASGASLSYDALVVAIGARPRDWLEGALHFGGAQDVAAFRRLLERLESGSQRRVAFVNPPAVTWTLPLYELALLTSSRVADRAIIGARLTLVTPEPDPLPVFGPGASRLLRSLLADRGIALKTGSAAKCIRDGKLELESGRTLEADQVVTLAQLEGPEVQGLPSDESGFIPVDEHSRVSGVEGVYAAGDVTSFPVKQGGVGTQQADAAAEAIAASLGVPIVPSPVRPILRGMLLTGIAPAFLRARITGSNGGSYETALNPLWWPPSKIAARHLAPYLSGHNALTSDRVLQDRAVSARSPEAVSESRDDGRALALAFAESDAADRDFKSALEWLDVLEDLDGVLPGGYLQKRADWQARTHGGRL
jgi:sulfide:quinone oxidoreductase